MKPDRSRDRPLALGVYGRVRGTLLTEVATGGFGVTFLIISLVPMEACL